MSTVKRKIHAVAAVASFIFIAAFWTSSVAAELFFSHHAVALVKHAIAYALIVFVPTIAAVGGTGFSMAGENPHALLAAKRRRMPVIVLTGLLVLIPAALFLNAKAQAGEFDTAFYLVQVLELLAGASNLTLIGMNIRDGLRLTRKAALAA